MSDLSPIDDEPATDTDNVPAIAGELRRALANYMDFAVHEWRETLAQVEAKQRGYVPPGERDDLRELRDYTRSAIDMFERVGRGAGHLDRTSPGDLSWLDISAEWKRDEAAGRALWLRVVHAARDELASGALGGQAIEGYRPRPIDRAHYLAVREALADGLQPRNGAERLLVDGMAGAWMMQLYWLSQHTKTNSMDAIRTNRDPHRGDGWEPPRLGEAEAVDRAAQMADRFQRQFLRLMKCYRDGRKLIASMTVLGGQVNVAEQQIVAPLPTDQELP